MYLGDAFISRKYKKHEREYPNLLLKLNIELCPQLILKLFGFNEFSLSWVFADNMSAIRIAVNPMFTKEQHI